MASQHEQTGSPVLRIQLPDGFSARDAENLARLLTTLAEGRWRYLESTFGRLAEAGVDPWPGPPGEALLSVAVELRRWQRSHAPEIRTYDRPGRR
jgi:hypothetical protein